MDLFANAEQLVREHLTAVGVNHSAASNLEDALHLALNRGMKRVTPAARKVHRCKNFDDKFTQLDGPKQKAANAILEKIERGDDINGHLSKGIERAERADDLLADWGIHHLHVSDTKDKPTDRFFKRTEEVLFVLFRPTAAYCIDIHSHDSKTHPTIWTRQVLFETIASNWPELVEPYRIKGVSGLSKSVTDEMRKTLRPNTLVTIEFNGAVYFPPGGGLSTANTPLQVGVDADHIMIWLEDIEERLKSKTDPALQEFATVVGVPMEKLDFALIADGPEHWVVVETKSNIPLTKVGHPFR